CPNDSVAFVGLSGEPERCVAGQSKCPVGFACQRSSGNHHICCATKQVECSSDEISVNGMCLPRSTPGQDCQQSEQCTGGSVCEAGSCLCPPLTKPMGGFCQAELKCGPEQVKHGNVCHNRVDLGKPCVTSEQCPDQGVCTDGICVCNERTVNLNGKCASPMARAKIVQSK
ncbi:EB module, partial [Teladorsagia circumcincta]